MRHIVVALGVGMLCLSIPVPAAAQNTTQRSDEEINAAYEKHKGEFDYLLGGSGSGYLSAALLSEPRSISGLRSAPVREPC